VILWNAASVWKAIEHRKRMRSAHESTVPPRRQNAPIDVIVTSRRSERPGAEPMPRWPLLMHLCGAAADRLRRTPRHSAFEALRLMPIITRQGST
jgi:hypothetical protein